MKIKRRTLLKTAGAGMGAALLARIASPITAYANAIKPEIQKGAKMKGEVSIEWLGHGSFRFESPGGKTVLLDPWLSTNPKCPAKYRTLKEFAWWPAKI